MNSQVHQKQTSQQQQQDVDLSLCGLPDIENVDALSSVLHNNNPTMVSFISFSSSRSTASSNDHREQQQFQDSFSSIDTTDALKTEECESIQGLVGQTSAQHQDNENDMDSLAKPNAITLFTVGETVVASIIPHTTGTNRSYLAEFLRKQEEGQPQRCSTKRKRHS